ncbi:hypothetical protein GCM10009665_26300 [Kitasatospora nipponensis]|uniref:Uncharacterized protein n=2 Tax=Kitasatospora nipponensis TaxID=258049 RepID=A0ABN1W4B6_9ACTN
MNGRGRSPVGFVATAWLLATVTLVGCGTHGRAAANWKPPFLPITFSIDTDGSISVQASAEVVTPVGFFSVEGDASRALHPPNGSTFVILRHKVQGSLVDDVYRIKSDQEMIAEIDGRTTIRINSHDLFIDASGGTIHKLTISAEEAKQQSSPTPPPTTGPLTDHLTRAEHRAGWVESNACRFGSDGYHVGPDPVYSWADCKNDAITVGDGEISVTARLVHAQPPDTAEEGFGLTILRNGVNVSFNITRDGTWWDASFADPVGSDPVHNSAIHAGVGARNRLTLRVTGYLFTFLVNGVQVGQVDEKESLQESGGSAAGTVELVAHHDQEVVFSDLSRTDRAG